MTGEPQKHSLLAPHPSALLLVRGDQNDLDIRMKQQDPEQLAAPIPGTAKDSCPELHASTASVFMEASIISKSFLPSRRAFPASSSSWERTKSSPIWESVTDP